MAHPEKEKVQRGISRRKFLIGGTFLGAGFLASGWGMERIARNFSPSLDLEKLKDFAVLPPDRPAPYELTGINLNSPFLWREVDSPEKIERAIQNANQFGARTIRIFINDEFEPELGNYRLEVLEKIEKLAQRFPLQVDLFDAYHLLHANKFNVVHGSSSLSSPYLMPKKEKSLMQRQLDFFTDETIQEVFLRRVKAILEHLNHVPQIVAWSVANELVPPAGSKKEARKILTNWYEKVVSAIRQIDKERPIVSGVADPGLLDEERLIRCGLSANSIHLYPDFLGTPENNLKFYQNQYQKALPLICQEIGFPSRLLGISFSFAYDELFSAFLSHHLSSFIEVNEGRRWVKPKVTTIGLWRLSFEGDHHRDGFEISPEKLPQTLKVLQTWKETIGRS